MKFIKKGALMALTLSMCLSMMSLTANAIEYTYDGDIPGGTFYQATSNDTDYIANNDKIVVGADGTVSTDVTGNVSSSPLSALDMPVGEYPDAWGTATDVAIASTSVFPNEFGPTSQTTAIYAPSYVPFTVNSGALPTGYATPAGASMGYNTVPYTGGVTYGTVYTNSEAAVPSHVAGVGNYFGLAVSASSMPSITKGGAIGKLTIGSVGINSYVYEGTSQTSMNKGLAHFDCTPGWGGNIALAGHNRGGSAYFAKLKDVQMGDVVKYTTAYGTRTYVVSNISTVSTDNTSGLIQDGSNKITMYTCKANQPEIKLQVVATLVG